VSTTTPAGFRAAGVAAGLKSTGAPDLALVVNDGPDHHAAAVFTSNRVEAAPVTWSRQVLTDGRVDAVVLNSGGANACTGAQGFADTHATAEKVADVLGVSAGDVVVCSTGLIGELLPMDKVLGGVDAAAAALHADGGEDAAVAIKTTDTVHKQAVAQRDGWSVGGMAKGAGMLAPALATMLVVVTTDAVVTDGELDAVLRAATAATFDRIDSDGCQHPPPVGVVAEDGALEEVVAGDRAGHLERVRLARGRPHLDGDVVVGTLGIGDELPGQAGADLRDRGRELVGAGGDARRTGREQHHGVVGRLAAVGTTRAAFDPHQLDVAMNSVQVCRAGGVGEDRSLVDLTAREVHVLVDLHAGDATATVWTNDLTHDYVHENSAYSS
jgi:glutamate N-acetyltransferase/amino-acid N-acetyltransferase